MVWTVFDEGVSSASRLAAGARAGADDEDGI
jgi:hypothetical protein